MISATDAVKIAGFLIKLVNALRNFAKTKGISPEEFNKSVAVEATRLDSWLSDLANGK